ncbi:hypothetical protein C0993_012655, partial [Termitomyces sp. T159_Od127]
DAIAKKITEEVDAEQLVNELNEAFDSLEAELKRPPSLPIKGPDDDDDTSLEDDSNVISSSPMAKRPLPKKRVVNVSTDSNPNDLSPAQERNPSNAATVSATRKTPSPPSPTAKRQFSKKRMVIIASDNDGNEVSSDTKKRCRRVELC